MLRFVFIFTIGAGLMFSAATPAYSGAFQGDEKKGSVSIGNPLSENVQRGAIDDSARQQALEQDLVQFIQGRLGNLVATMMLLLAGLAIIPVVVGGFQLIISQGGKYAEKGKQTLFWGVVGLAVGLTGYVIFGVLLDLLI